MACCIIFTACGVELRERSIGGFHSGFLAPIRSSNIFGHCADRSLSKRLETAVELAKGNHCFLDHCRSVFWNFKISRHHHSACPIDGRNTREGARAILSKFYSHDFVSSRFRGTFFSRPHAASFLFYFWAVVDGHIDFECFIHARTYEFLSWSIFAWSDYLSLFFDFAIGSSLHCISFYFQSKSVFSSGLVSESASGVVRLESSPKLLPIEEDHEKFATRA